MDRALNNTSRKLIWPITIIVSAVFAGLLAWTNPGGSLQRLIVFWFLVICPGMAFIGLLNLQDSLTQLVLSVALSLVMSVIVSEFMLLTRQWSPLTILLILIGLSLIGAIFQISNAIKPDLAARKKT